MSTKFDAGIGDCSPDLPAPAAAADGPVADDGEHVAAGQLRVTSEPERLDPETVERERQARLKRWQRQP